MLSPENERWLAAFVAAHGRAPRVLHIGNIANNAYLNAKFLNARGFDCDVACYDYYHIMGCPEWEDARFSGSLPADHFRPDWVASGVSDFERPRWFAQGPQELCLKYLLARRDGQQEQAARLWAQLAGWNGTGAAPAAASQGAAALHSRLGRASRSLMAAGDPAGLLRSRLRPRLAALGPGARAAAVAAEPLVRGVGFGARAIRWASRRVGRRPAHAVGLLLGQREALERDFEALFAPRRAVFGDALQGYDGVLPAWRELLGRYDVVIGYSTDGVYPLLAGKRPYIAFEHGTIRSIPFNDDAQGQLCALTYRRADGVAITNADNIVAAGKLGLESRRFVPHPINDEVLRTADAGAPARLHAELDSDFVVFHPARQHWEARRHPDWEKGNDLFLRGFARLVKDAAPRAAAVLVNWGACVEQSRALVTELGIEHRVKWIEPLPHRPMMDMINACDAVADQFWLGAFGSTMPKALAAGKPALLYLDEELHRWCFPEMPPVTGGRSEDAVFDALHRLYTDPAWRQEVGRRGRDWYARYHSSDTVADSLCDLFRASIAP